MKIREDLRRDGFSFCSRLLAELATAQVADVLGILVNVSELLPENVIGTRTKKNPACIEVDRALEQRAGYKTLFPTHRVLM
jgi:hypothetical protein